MHAYLCVKKPVCANQWIQKMKISRLDKLSLRNNSLTKTVTWRSLRPFLKYVTARSQVIFCELEKSNMFIHETDIDKFFLIELNVPFETIFSNARSRKDEGNEQELLDLNPKGYTCK